MNKEETLTSRQRRSRLRRQIHCELLNLARMEGVSKQEIIERLREERKRQIDEMRREAKRKRQEVRRVVDFELDEFGRPSGAPRLRIGLEQRIGELLKCFMPIEIISTNIVTREIPLERVGYLKLPIR